MPYAELHCHSAFSFLDGASHPVEIAAAAAEQGHSAIALTDHDGLYGSMELAMACRPLGVRALVGAELTLEDGHHVTLLCEDREGYGNLCRLITLAHAHTRDRPTEPTPPETRLEDLERHAAGLVCLSGCARDGAVAARVERDEHPAAAPSRACCAPSVPTASGSSSSARSHATTAVATGCSRSLPSASASRASPPGTSMRTRARAPRSRTRL
jgi:DNA polymerase III alpha subunit